MHHYISRQPTSSVEAQTSICASRITIQYLKHQKLSIMAPVAVEAAPTASHLLSKTTYDQPIKSSAPAVQQPQLSQYQGYHNVHWYVGNAKQAAAFYVTRMGFQRIAYRGLETGSRAVASHVVSNGNVVFVFTSPLHAPNSKKQSLSKDDRTLLRDIHEHLTQHGDAVKDVGFEVDDVEALYSAAVSKGARAVSAPTAIEDEYGVVKMATIQTYGDTSKSILVGRCSAANLRSTYSYRETRVSRVFSAWLQNHCRTGTLVEVSPNCRAGGD